MTEAEALLAFNLLPNIGPHRVRRLVEAFGSAASALGAPEPELRRVQGLGSELAAAIRRWEDSVDLARELRRIREVDAAIVTWNDPAYPAALRESHAPPMVLYVRGRLDERDRHAIAIVGSRRTSHYGLNCARKFAFQLAASGLTVVSGLARGIDTSAHEAALAANGRTIAVLGSGLGKLYPPENHPLADRIAEPGNGAVVTEFPVDYPPDKQSFPLRNRIVAAWGHGILVVEAPSRSGALITANQAADAGRTVYAIPGPIDRPTHAGTNNLLKNGARLVTDAGDIIEDMSFLLPQQELFAPDFTGNSKAGPALSGDESTVYAALPDDEIHIDDLVSRTGLTTSVVSTTLMRLQLKRLVKQLPGSYFVKLLS